MIAMRYGTLPIVRATGGLVDTVTENAEGGGTGYRFYGYSVEALLTALGKAQEHYVYCPDLWYRTQLRAMRSDFSWERSAQEYDKLYRGLSV